MAKDDDIPAARQPAEENPEGEAPRVTLGPAFAIARDCGLVEGRATAVVQCDDCNQAFRLDLLAEGYSQCPNCDAEYTSALLVSRSDDDEIFLAATRMVFESSGYFDQADDDDGDDDDDDDQGGDGDQADQADQVVKARATVMGGKK